MTSASRLQELPPAGGFGKISYEKVPHKTFFNGKRIALLTALSYGFGIWGYYESWKFVRRAQLEVQSGQNAIQPFLLAERDRQLLRTMRRNRDAETELMKDVPGWEVGTLFGTPVYNTVGQNEWIGYLPQSYYAHADPSEVIDYVRYDYYV